MEYITQDTGKASNVLQPRVRNDPIETKGQGHGVPGNQTCKPTGDFQTGSSQVVPLKRNTCEQIPPRLLLRLEAKAF